MCVKLPQSDFNLDFSCTFFFVSWTYLPKLLMLYIKLALLDVDVHCPQTTVQGHPFSIKTTFSLRSDTERKKKIAVMSVP